MYFVIDVVKIIIIGIFLIYAIGFWIRYLFVNLGYYIKHNKKHKRQSKQLKINKEKAIEIIDKFEDLLDVNDIKIPNVDREGDKDEACIYGSDYYNLEESIIEILNR